MAQDDDDDHFTSFPCGNFLGWELQARRKVKKLELSFMGVAMKRRKGNVGSWFWIGYFLSNERIGCFPVLNVHLLI
jgi:hypothetical protein